MIRPKDPTEVNVDTTVQSKAIALPTDSRLYSKMLGKLVRESRNAGLVLRQSYVRVTKYSLVMQGRYAKARQMNRSRKVKKNAAYDSWPNDTRHFSEGGGDPGCWKTAEFAGIAGNG